MTSLKLSLTRGRTEAVPGEQRHKLGAAAQIELFVRPADVRVQGRRREAEVFGRLLFRRAARERRDHLGLALRQSQPIAQLQGGRALALPVRINNSDCRTAGAGHAKTVGASAESDDQLRSPRSGRTNLAAAAGCRHPLEFRIGLWIVKLKPALMQADRFVRVEHRPRGRVRMDEPQGAVDEQNGVAEIFEHQIGRGEHLGGPLPVQADAERPPEMAGEAPERRQIVPFEIAERSVTECDDHRRSAFLEQRWERHDPMEALAPEPVGIELRAHEDSLRHHHSIGQRLISARDLPPYRIAGSEALVGWVQVGIDAEGTETAELMRPHVLQSEADARGTDDIRDLLQREGPGAIVGCTVVDETHEPIVIVDHLASPGGSDQRFAAHRL